jgi:hypothetical protein
MVGFFLGCSVKRAREHEREMTGEVEEDQNMHGGLYEGSKVWSIVPIPQS